jgi:hypothetical protein
MTADEFKALAVRSSTAAHADGKKAA